MPIAHLSPHLSQAALANLPPFAARSKAPGGEDAVVTVTNPLDSGTNSGDGNLCVAGTRTRTMVRLELTIPHTGIDPSECAKVARWREVELMCQRRPPECLRRW